MNRKPRSARFLRLWLPEKLRKPGCRVVLVCGPPGSGKSSYVRANRKDADAVIDLDEIKEDISDQLVERSNFNRILISLEERNRRLDALADRKDGTGWLIAGCPLSRDRSFWRKTMSAEVVVLETSQETCVKRIMADETRDSERKARSRRGVSRWWSDYQRDPGDIVICRED